MGIDRNRKRWKPRKLLEIDGKRWKQTYVDRNKWKQIEKVKTNVNVCYG